MKTFGKCFHGANWFLTSLATGGVFWGLLQWILHTLRGGNFLQEDLSTAEYLSAMRRPAL